MNIVEYFIREEEEKIKAPISECWRSQCKADIQAAGNYYDTDEYTHRVWLR